MPETVTWDKVGQATWCVEVGLDDGDDPRATSTIVGEYPAHDLELAKADAERQLREHTNPPAAYPGAPRGIWWACVSRGTYQDASFDSSRDGYVCDATWEPDVDGTGVHVEYMAYLGNDGGIAWDEPDFVPEGSGAPEN